jgi:hypothetical protein
MGSIRKGICAMEMFLRLMGLSYNGSLDSDVHFARIKRMGGRTREI